MSYLAKLAPPVTADSGAPVAAVVRERPAATSSRTAFAPSSVPSSIPFIDESKLAPGQKVRPGCGVESARDKSLYENAPIKGDRSFSHLRYTSCEGSATKFTSNGYRLRCLEHNIKILIGVSMYAEAGEEMDFTLRQGICKNLANFHKSGVGTSEITWDNVAVVIISDGRTKANKSALKWAADRGFYDEKMLHRYKSDNATMHLFEYTPQFKNEMGGSYCLPLQTIYAIKEHNGGKLDSHYWFFDAFAEQLMPEYTFLIDVGTKPESFSIVRLFAAMERNTQIGGCCGEIAVANPNYCSVVQAAQHYEYKSSNFMGKTMESLFGYIAVLPGAFSAYRYQAIRGQPLQRYFYSLSHTLSPFKANMYLAEDRILCLELLAKQGCNWILHYVKDAPAITDVPETMTALIKQRRRWLNGSFFAQIYSVAHFGRVWTESSHSFFRKFALTVEFTYFLITSLFAWFNVANFYVAFRLLINDFFLNADIVKLPTGLFMGKTLAVYIIEISQFIWIFFLVIQVIISLRNKPEDVAFIHKLSAAVFAFFGYAMIGMLTYSILFGQAIPVEIKIATIVTFLSPVICAVFHLEVAAILLTFFQYYFMLPTYVNVFTIYSLCNTHDVSWGTKGIETEHVAKVGDSADSAYAGLSPEDKAIKIEQDKVARATAAKKEADARESRFKTYSSNLLIFWMLCNLLWVGALSQFNFSGVVYTVVLFFGAAFQQGCLMLGSILFAILFYLKKMFYGIIYICTCSCCTNKQTRANKVPKKRNMAATEAIAGRTGENSNYIIAALGGVGSPTRRRGSSNNTPRSRASQFV